MANDKFPHIDTALKENELKPKHFCELCGVDPNNATKIKKIAIMSGDGKRFLVRETLQACKNYSKFGKSDMYKILSKLTTKTSKSKTEKRKMRTK